MKTEKRKVSFMLAEQTLKKLEELQGQVNCKNKSEFIEKLLEFALEELEKELRRNKTVHKKEEKVEELGGMFDNLSAGEV